MMDIQTNTNGQTNSQVKTSKAVILFQDTDKENRVLRCKKPRCQQAFWNLLHPHESHQHPTLTKYFASNCVAEVLFFAALKFQAVFTDSVLTTRAVSDLSERKLP